LVVIQAQVLQPADRSKLKARKASTASLSASWPRAASASMSLLRKTLACSNSRTRPTSRCASTSRASMARLSPRPQALHGGPEVTYVLPALVVLLVEAVVAVAASLAVKAAPMAALAAEVTTNPATAKPTVRPNSPAPAQRRSRRQLAPMRNQTQVQQKISKLPSSAAISLSLGPLPAAIHLWRRREHASQRR